MADGARANRPTSAVEKMRVVREGGALLRPASESAGVWHGKPSTMLLAKENQARDFFYTSESHGGRK
jgi:hypothetical protein